MENLILQELREIKQFLALQKTVWNMDDFCRYTGFSKPYAYHLTSTSKLKFYRPVGKKIFFDPEIVCEFLKQNPIDGIQVTKSKLNNYLLNNKNS
jgi:hypothetical protein